MNPIFQGHVAQGVLYLDDLPAYEKQIALLDGKPIELVLRRHREQRSSQQNRYLHGVVIPMLAEHCGYEPFEMKDALKWRFLQTHTDGKLPSVRSTADLNTAEFAEFTEQCRRLAAELGCVIPDPQTAE